MSNAADHSAASFLRNAMAPLVLRVALATIFIFHGYAKISHDWGASWDRGMDLHLSPVVGVIVAWGEIIGGTALLVGFLTRLAALGIAVIMAGAIWTVTGQFGFIIADRGPEQAFRQAVVGYEYNVAVLAICLTLMIYGGGAIALDRLLWRRKKEPL
jgi:putative oxidoreductase